MVFDQVQYVTSHHAEMQLVERKNIPLRYAKTYLLDMVTKGNIIIEIDDMRYIKSDDLYLPCVKWLEKGENIYRIKSVLTWDMVEKRIQNIIRKYHGEYICMTK